MNREILIANTKTQQSYTIQSSATTLGELQDQMSAMGIDFRGMSFTEGISKTQLTDRDSQLPTNVMYKGQPTNRLAILLTNTTKNIASGAVEVREYSRKEAYAVIKEMGPEAAAEIKRQFGRNFTQVPTTSLWEYINAHSEETENPETTEETQQEEQKKPADVKDAPHPDTVEWIYIGIKSMVKNGLLYIDDVAVIADLVSELYSRLKEEEPKIDLNEMLKNF